jgi:lipopolysaccharide heptosyltransferase II
MATERTKEIFENNPFIHNFILYDKKWSLRRKIALFFNLKKQQFDLVVDLRHSLYGWLLPAKFKTPTFFRIIPKNIKHMKKRYLYLVRKIIPETKEIKIRSFYTDENDEKYVENLLRENAILKEDKIIVVASGARSHLKCWQKEKFVDLINELKKDFKIILVGDKDDIIINSYIFKRTLDNVYDFTGKTNLRQLASLLKKAVLLITNDSAVMHLGSYLNIPIIAIFGPTDDNKYGPWSEKSSAVRKEVFCRPCQKAQCRFKTLDCMKLIKVEEVLNAVRKILSSNNTQYSILNTQYRRILVVRTDRIGDVVLSTPVIKNLRRYFPYSYIAMMVSPYTKELIEGNPYLDEVIVYDKENKHKSWFSSMRFSINLKKKKFDLAIILHPTNRVHLVTFFAGIPKRLGYNRKLGFLLTDRIPHTKQLGQKHESEYNLDLLRYLGLKDLENQIFVPIKEEAKKYVDQLLKKQGIREDDFLIAVHPSATCPSKRWPLERFAELCDKLKEKYNLKILVVAGPKDIDLAKELIEMMKEKAINLAGRLSLGELAYLLKRCRLFISNDSGPVHISSAVGTPVISIFGRNQKGLSPIRWGPLGRYDRVIHKEVGCQVCLAHNCQKGFLCLKAISVEEVLEAIEEILSSK